MIKVALTLIIHLILHFIETFDNIQTCVLLVRAETARVFGNLSRRVEIRQCFHDDGEFAAVLGDLDKSPIFR